MSTISLSTSRVLVSTGMLILPSSIAANMIPFGSDSTMLFPRFLTIPRGQLLVEILGFAICPWKILASASIFTTFLSGYGLFMASVAATMICDYFCLTRGNIFVAHLYNGSRDNKHYYYDQGWNGQAVMAYVVGVALPFPGFVGALSVSKSARQLGNLGWMLSFTVSFVVYWGLCLVWATRNQRMAKQMGLAWEEMSYHEPMMGKDDGAVVAATNDMRRRGEEEMTRALVGESAVASRSSNGV